MIAYSKKKNYELLTGSVSKGEEEGTFYVLHIIPLIFSLPSTAFSAIKRNGPCKNLSTNHDQLRG